MFIYVCIYFMPLKLSTYGYVYKYFLTHTHTHPWDHTLLIVKFLFSLITESWSFIYIIKYKINMIFNIFIIVSTWIYYNFFKPLSYFGTFWLSYLLLIHNFIFHLNFCLGPSSCISLICIPWLLMAMSSQFLRFFLSVISWYTMKSSLFTQGII